VTAVALALAVGAQATAPKSESFAATSLDSLSCTGFDAIIERIFTGRETVYFDRQADAVRVRVVADMRGSVTNSTTRKTVALRGHIALVIDPSSGSFTFVGPVFMANDAGAGIVIEDTGRIVFDADGQITFEAGPHEVTDTNGAIFCSAVS
jgi:hypothetical protein